MNQTKQCRLGKFSQSTKRNVLPWYRITKTEANLPTWPGSCSWMQNVCLLLTWIRKNGKTYRLARLFGFSVYFLKVREILNLALNIEIIRILVVHKSTRRHPKFWSWLNKSIFTCLLDLLCEVARKPKMKTQLNAKSNRNILASFSLFIERLNRFIRERFKYKTICLRLSQTRKNGKTRKTKQLILMIICQELIPKGSLFISYRDVVHFWMTFKLAIFFQNECSTISKWNHASINDDDSMGQTHWCLFLRAAFEWLHANDSWAYF